MNLHVLCLDYKGFGYPTKTEIVVESVFLFNYAKNLAAMLSIFSSELAACVGHFALTCSSNPYHVLAFTFIPI
ncbi:hypothetical protein ACH3XW_35120 [Acanthocheilonema viteae]